MPALTEIVAGLASPLGIRLLGVSVTQFGDSATQMSLFDGILGAAEGGDVPDDIARIERRWDPASRAIDAIRGRFGRGAIGSAGSLDARPSNQPSPWGPRDVPRDVSRDDLGDERRN
jgi:hypothetical protein